MDQSLNVTEKEITRLTANNFKQSGVSATITYIQHQQ